MSKRENECSHCRYLRICPTHPRHETKMTSVSEPRETSCKPLGAQRRGIQLSAWNSSESVTMRDEHRTAREVYGRGKTKLSGGNTGQVMRKAMSAPEGNWSCRPRATCDSQKGPLPRRVFNNGQCEAGAEQKEMWLCQALILAAGSVTGNTEGGTRRDMQRKT